MPRQKREDRKAKIRRVGGPIIRVQSSDIELPEDQKLIRRGQIIKYKDSSGALRKGISVRSASVSVCKSISVRKITANLPTTEQDYDIPITKPPKQSGLNAED